MNIEKKELPKSQVELNVELGVEEFKPFIEKGAKKISEEVKIDGFRKGSVPYDILKQKIGEMTILEEGARIAINKKLEAVLKENIAEQIVGMPKVDITKLAPGNPLVFKVVVSLLPEIVPGEYKGLKIKPVAAKTEKADLDRSLNELREMRVQEKLTDRPVQDKDKVLVDVQMFLDNVPVEGGQGKDSAVIIGQDYIVPGFDKQLIGLKKGESKEFKLPYPKDHYMKNLAGKMVEFKATVKEVYERSVPELNDEFAKGFGLKDFEDLKNNLEKNIKDHKQREADLQTEREMLEKIMAKTKFGDLAEDLITHETDTMKAEIKQDISKQGGKYEDYLKSISKTDQELTLELMPEAVKRVKVSLLIKEIAKKEKIEAKEEDVEKQLEEAKKYYKNSPELLERFSSPEYRNYVRNVLGSRAVLDKLKEWNVAG